MINVRRAQKRLNIKKIKETNIVYTLNNLLPLFFHFSYIPPIENFSTCWSTNNLDLFYARHLNGRLVNTEVSCPQIVTTGKSFIYEFQKGYIIFGHKP